MKKGTFPEYDNPPVVETILGVHFDRLSGFQNAHLGAFWKSLDTNQWPIVSDAPPLPPQFERFTETAKWAKGLQLQLTQDPSSRLQIKNNEGNRMIQVQNGRLHLNWLGQAGGAYPRYTNVREEFVWLLKQFTNFISDEKVGEFRPNQWELTYLNHIPKGTVWNTPKDWGFFRPFGAMPTIEGVIQGEGFSGEWTFTIPEQRGRLRVRWQHGLKSNPEKQEIVVLTFIARGSLEQDKSGIEAVLEGLDLGHEVIVCSFEKLMTAEANKYWRLKHATG